MPKNVHVCIQSWPGDAFHKELISDLNGQNDFKLITPILY